jgi:LacI family transcriptional regulator
MVKASIEDVAARAGLSVATVDRVLNGRAKVRPSNAKRVEAAVRALNYHPDRLAARLARGRDYRFCFIVPKGQNDFMISIEREISNHAQHLQAERVSADVIHVDTFDSTAMVSCLDSMAGFDGVALVALDDPRVKEAINRLVAKGVAVVTLVSDVPGSHRSHYIGIDNAAAGRTAATLMGRYLEAHSGDIAIIAGSLSLRDHAERHFGFQQVMLRDFPNLTLLPVLEARDSNDQTNNATKKLLDKTPDLNGIYNLGAGTLGFVEALTNRKSKNRVVAIAHELNDISRKALVDGILDVVISQDPGHEVRSAMRLLMAKCDRLPVYPAMERIGIDIFVRDNLP